MVPSPTISSYEVAALPIIAAVGCWIYISCKSTAPSLVNLIYPAPPTSIFIVPFGPKFDFNTSYKPLAALIFTLKA